MEQIRFNQKFTVIVEVENDQAEIAAIQNYLTDRRINWHLNFTKSVNQQSIAPIFVYECTLLDATSIYLDIRSMGLTAIRNDIMNKEVAALINRRAG